MLTSEQAITKVNTLYAELDDRRPVIEKRERYFDGQQPLAYASDEWKKFHQNRYAAFSDNWCEVVGRAAPERQVPFGIRLGDDVEAQSPDEKILWRDWELNEGPAQSAQGFLSGGITARSFALVWGNDDDEPELTWEHSTQSVVGYSMDGRRQAVAAMKTWCDCGMEYATLYTVDEVWKFQRKKAMVSVAGLHLPASLRETGNWDPREDVELVVGHDMGVVPMVEFPNRPLLKTGPISDIDGTMAMQDAINLFWAYLFTAADFASMPARVVLGQEPPKIPILDANGQKIGEKAVDGDALKAGRMLWLSGQNTKIGQWDASKLDIFTDVLNVMVKHTASKTRTPIHYIMGELGNVNGDTLTATELPLAKKVHEGNKHLTGPMREVFRRFALVRGDKRVADACRTAVVQWQNPETASDSQTADAAIKAKTVGWPFEAILERIYGLSQPEIQRVLQQRAAEGDTDPILGLADKLMGGNPPPDDAVRLNGGRGAPTGVL